MMFIIYYVQQIVDPEVMNMYSEVSERSFFSRVFLHMTWALTLTALTAYGIASYPPVAQAVLSNTAGLLLLMVLEVILVYTLSRRIMSMSVLAVYVGLIVFAFVNGVTLSLIFMAYTAESIFTVFFAAAGLFLVTSLFGYATKKDLSTMGRFLYMSLFGLVIALVLNLFIRSSPFMYLVSFIGVFIFSGLTAYDMQYLKRMRDSASFSPEQYEKIALYGALKLYLDFINLFLNLLRLFGRRR
jgi:FtsH-binding integral membrane protein